MTKTNREKEGVCWGACPENVSQGVKHHVVALELSIFLEDYSSILPVP